MSPEDPLAALLTDAEDYREELADALSGLVTISRETGDLLFTNEYLNLDARSKVLVALLALNAAAMLDLRSSAAVAPSALVEITALPGGTVRPRLRELVAARLVMSRSGSYELPNAFVPQAIAELASATGGVAA